MLQDLVGQKDQQIAELQDQLFRMREQLIAANMDSDKASITALTQVAEAFFPPFSFSS